MANSNTGVFSLTHPALLAFDRGLFVKTAYQGKGDEKYSAQLILKADHPDLPAIKDVIRRVANEAQPGIDISAFNKPLRSGTKEADRSTAKSGDKYKKLNGLMRGNVVIVSRTKYQPRMAVLVPGQGIVGLTDDTLRAKYKDKFYPGVDVIAEFNFSWYPATKEGDRPGVTCYINQVLSTGKGERLGGGRTPQEAFSGYLGAMSSASPLGGAVDDDEIPF